MGDSTDSSDNEEKGAAGGSEQEKGTLESIATKLRKNFKKGWSTPVLKNLESLFSKSEKTSKYLCPTCNKGFDNPRAVKSHRSSAANPSCKPADGNYTYISPTLGDTVDMDDPALEYDPNIEPTAPQLSYEVSSKLRLV